MPSGSSLQFGMYDGSPLMPTSSVGSDYFYDYASGNNAGVLNDKGSGFGVTMTHEA